MNRGGDGLLRRRLLLDAGEIEQMIVNRALLLIYQDLIGAHDLAKLDRRIGVAGIDVGVSRFDGFAKRGPDVFSVIVRKRSEQIVKRLHRRSRRPPKSISLNSRREFLGRTRTLLHTTLAIVVISTAEK